MEETLFIKNRQDKHQCLSKSVLLVHPLPVCYPGMSLKDLKVYYLFIDKNKLVHSSSQ